MKSKLDIHQSNILDSRVALAKDSHLFTTQKLGKEWNISPSTVLRYTSPKDRELSRSAAKKGRDKFKETGKNCYVCKDSLAIHKRCPMCTILVHGLAECGCTSIDKRRPVQYRY